MNIYADKLKPTKRKSLTRMDNEIMSLVSRLIKEIPTGYTDEHGHEWVYGQDLHLSIMDCGKSKSTAERYVNSCQHLLIKGKECGRVIYRLNPTPMTQVVKNEVTESSRIKVLAKILSDVYDFKDAISHITEAFVDSPDVWGDHKNTKAMLGMIKESLFELSNEADNLVIHLDDEMGA